MTLLEMLIVIVIVGILARIAIVKSRATKDPARLAAIKTDLHNLEIAEESYLNDFKKYGTLAQLRNANLFQLSPDNTMAIATAARGFTATGTNATITSSIKKCTVHVGAGAASTVDGVMTCP